MNEISITYYPRIPDSIAIMEIEEMIRLSPAELSARAAASHHAMTYYPTASEFAKNSDLLSLRNELVELATSLGFPNPPSKDQARKFDQAAANILDDSTELVPAEAANREVWNFLTVVLLPDLAKWRYSNSQNNLTYDRWLGGDRNVFRKLWWRVVTLSKELSSQLGEDEVVAIMERPLLSANPYLARASAQALLTVAKEFPDVARSELMRRAMFRIRSKSPIVSFEILEESEVNEIVLDLFRTSSAQFAKHIRAQRAAETPKPTIEEEK